MRAVRGLARRATGHYPSGFFLGDGAGVGKGRQIAGLIYEHYRSSGRRVLWVSVSSDLKFDAERDLNDLDISPEISVFPKKNASLPASTPLKKQCTEGVVFCTYSLLVAGSPKVLKVGMCNQPGL